MANIKLKELFFPKNIFKMLTTQFGSNPATSASNEGENLQDLIQEAIDEGELTISGGGSANLSLGAATLTTRAINNSGGTGVTLPSATTITAGLLSANDKSKLDNLSIYVPPNHTGDVVSVGDGVTAISPDAVTNQKLANMPAYTIKARPVNSVGDPQDLVIPVNTIVGRNSGNIIPLTLGTKLSMFGSILNVEPSYDTIESSGTPLPNREIINFTGSGVAVTDDGTKTVVTINTGSGGSTPTDLTYAPLSGSGIVQSSTGTDATITARNTSFAGLMLPADVLDIEDLTTLSGVASNQTDLGTFSGTIIPDNQTIKQALQSLETSLGSVGSVITKSAITPLSGGGKAICTYVGTAPTWTRTSPSVWTITVPNGTELMSMDIYSSQSDNPGPTLTLNINSSSTIYNQDITTLHIPMITGVALGSGAGSSGNYAPTTGASNLLPTVQSTPSNGDIIILINQFNSSSALGTGATNLKLIW